MHIIIIGAGEVGAYLAQILIDQNHNITIIDQDAAVCQQIDAAYDARVVQGNGSSAHMLAQANVQNCDALLAMTPDDRTNIMACSLGKALGAKLSICRVHDQTYAEWTLVNYQLHFNIDLFVNPEALCAAQLAKIIRNPDRVAVETFTRGTLIAQRIKIHEQSTYVNLNLQSIQMPQNARILYMERKDTIIIPNTHTTLQEHDEITVLGDSKALSVLKQRLHPYDSNKTCSVVIYSASETALSLIRLLQDSRYKIHLIEKDPMLCNSIVSTFRNVTAIHGDATSLKLLQDEQVGYCDFFIACSKDDENNIMTAIQAKRLGAKHTQIVINKPDYEPILESLTAMLGLEQTVSPRLATAAEAARLVSQAPYTELAPLPKNAGKIIELKVNPISSAAGLKLEQIRLPPSTSVLLLTHKYHAKIPTPTDLILGTDRLVILVTLEHLNTVVSLFTAGITH